MVSATEQIKVHAEAYARLGDARIAIVPPSERVTVGYMQGCLNDHIFGAGDFRF